jgi:uncharacterized protein (DUF488 family)
MSEYREIKLFTIGFAKKNAEEFFTKLKKANIKTLIDIRLNNISQLAGFTKKNDLEYFLREICGINYIYRPEWAPTKDILDNYKKKNISWQEYADKYNNLLLERKITNDIDLNELNMACLLCSELTPDKCHRKLLSEYFKKNFNNIDILHL